MICGNDTRYLISRVQTHFRHMRIILYPSTVYRNRTNYNLYIFTDFCFDWWPELSLNNDLVSVPYYGYERNKLASLFSELAKCGAYGKIKRPQQWNHIFIAAVNPLTEAKRFQSRSTSQRHLFTGKYKNISFQKWNRKPTKHLLKTIKNVNVSRNAVIDATQNNKINGIPKALHFIGKRKFLTNFIANCNEEKSFHQKDNIKFNLPFCFKNFIRKHWYYDVPIRQSVEF